MRWHLRLVVLCAIAVFAAGCTNTDKPDLNGSTVSGPFIALGGCAADVGDRIWYDTNCNGIQDKDETGGPEGIKVTLIDCTTGGTVQGTLTDSNGYYVFHGVSEGSYKLCFELPGGFGWSPKDQGGNDGLDSDVNSGGCTDCFTLECDKPNLTKDAGLCEKKGGGEGCTPGFWKNHYTHWGPTGYTPTMVFDDVFGCDIFGDDTTLGQAVHVEWTHNVLAFHAVAALLNASHPDVDFGLSVDEVKELACAGDKNSLAEENEKGCPLSGGNTTGNGNK